MVNVAVMASGNGSNFENLVLSDLKYAKIKVLIVDKKEAYAKERAKKLNIDAYFVDPKAYHDKATYELKIIEIFKQYDIEIISLAGYMRFVGAVLLQKFPRRIINLHPAYLPDFPGAHSIEDAYHAQVESSGVTLHFVDEGIDTGEIIKQEKVKVLKSLEAFEMAIHKKEFEMFPRVLDQVCQEVNHEKSVN